MALAHNKPISPEEGHGLYKGRQGSLHGGQEESQQTSLNNMECIFLLPCHIYVTHIVHPSNVVLFETG